MEFFLVTMKNSVVVDLAANLRRVGQAEAVAEWATAARWDWERSLGEKWGSVFCALLTISEMQLTQDGDWVEGHWESGS